MISKRAWETYPSNYRAREIEILAGWIRAGESGSIVGLAGAGKSNLLGFLTHRPEAMTPYLEDSPLKLALVLVDLNNLPGNDLATFYRVILRSLYEAHDQLAAIEESLLETVERLYGKVEEKTDPFLSQSALRETLLLFRKKGVHLVLALDPFDRFCRAATTQVLDNLRGLRDSFKATYSYIVGLRRELAYIRDPVELGELYEILDTHVCWVGPMEHDDARWVIGQVEGAVNQSFEDGQVEQLIHLTGGYPALLRAASLWLARGSPNLEHEAWTKALLTEPSVQGRLQELWQGLTGEEQFALSELQALQGEDYSEKMQKSYQDIRQEHGQVFARLQEKRICYLDEKNRWQVFSPLWAAYIDQVGRTSSGKIWRRETDDVIFKGNISLEEELTSQDRRLLIFFLEHPYKVSSKDDIIFALWPDEAIATSIKIDPDVTLTSKEREKLSSLLKRRRDLDKYDIISALWPDAISVKDTGMDEMRLQQAVSHLRGILGDKGKDTHHYIQTVRGTGYRFFPEGAPPG